PTPDAFAAYTPVEPLHVYAVRHYTCVAYPVLPEEHLGRPRRRDCDVAPPVEELGVLPEVLRVEVPDRPVLRVVGIKRLAVDHRVEGTDEGVPSELSGHQAVEAHYERGLRVHHVYSKVVQLQRGIVWEERNAVLRVRLELEPGIQEDVV